jgi:hypothetical protein
MVRLTEVNVAGACPVNTAAEEMRSGFMIGKILAVGVLVGSTLILASGAVANSPSASEDSEAESISIDLGERDFRSYCAACHGVSATGDGTLAEFLTISVPDLTKLTKKNTGKFPRDKVVRVIDGRADVKVHGDRDMPVWGEWFNKEAIEPGTDPAAREQIVSERIDALVNYIESLQAK